MSGSSNNSNENTNLHANQNGSDRAVDTRQSNREPLDPGSQALAQALKRCFFVLKIVMIVVVGFFIYSGAYKVEQNEQAVVLRFGRVTGGLSKAIKKPGWHWAWPYPIDEKIIMPGPKAERRLNIDDFWYYQTEKEKAGVAQPAIGQTLQFVRDGYSLTASKSAAQVWTQQGSSSLPARAAAEQENIPASVTDYNLMHTRWVIRYRVDNALDFVAQLWDGTSQARSAVDDLLRSVLADAVIVVSANRDIEWIIWDKPDPFRSEVEQVLADRLDHLKVGLKVSLDFIDKTPPRQVKYAFDAAARAGTQARQLETAAQAQASEIVSAARAEADIIIAQAQAYRTKIVQAAQADAKYLSEVLDKIKVAVHERVPQNTPDYLARRKQMYDQLLAVTVAELYQEMLREVVGNADEVFVFNTSEGAELELRPVLSRDPTLKKRTSKEEVSELGGRPIGSPSAPPPMPR